MKFGDVITIGTRWAKDGRIRSAHCFSELERRGPNAAAACVEALRLQMERLNYSRFFWTLQRDAVFHLSYRGGWVYEISCPDSPSGGLCNFAADTVREAEFKVRRHVAQYSYDSTEDPGVGEPPTLACLDPRDTEGRADHLRWVEFQRSYRRGIAAGLSAEAAYAAASGRP